MTLISESQLVLALFAIINTMLWFNINRHIKKTDDIQSRIEIIERDYVRRKEFESLTQKISYLEHSCIERQELNAIVSDMKLSIKDTEGEVRKMMTRVHERIDVILEKKCS